MYIRYQKDGKAREVDYQRFVYAAWNQDTFDIKDRSLVVVADAESDRFAREVSRLTVITRKQHIARLTAQRTKLTAEDKEKAYETWQLVKDHMTVKAFAERLNVDPIYMRSILREQENKT